MTSTVVEFKENYLNKNRDKNLKPKGLISRSPSQTQNFEEVKITWSESNHATIPYLHHFVRYTENLSNIGTDIGNVHKTSKTGIGLNLFTERGSVLLTPL